MKQLRKDAFVRVRVREREREIERERESERERKGEWGKRRVLLFESVNISSDRHLAENRNL